VPGRARRGFEKLCPCFGAALLLGDPQRATLEDLERAAFAGEARLRGFVPHGTADAEALSRLRGRGGRRERLGRGIGRAWVMVASRPALRAELATSLRLVRHLRREGISDHEELRDHLAGSTIDGLELHLTLSRIFGVPEVIAALTGARPAPTKRLAIAILAALRGRTRGAIERQWFRRLKAVPVVKVELNALDRLFPAG